MRIQTTIAPVAGAISPTIQQISAPIMVAFGLGLTTAWTFLLGYVLVTAIGNIF
jgi:hypothetical protein